METAWDVSYSFCSGSFIGLVNTYIWSFHLLQTNFQIFFFFFSFLSVQRAYFLKLTLFGLVNVDGVFLGNKLVDSRMALLFLATVFERAICFVLKVAD